MAHKTLSNLTEAATTDTGDFLYAVVGGNSRKVRRSFFVTILDEAAYSISTNGAFTLPSDRLNIVLTPTVPSVRTVSLPAAASSRFSVADGNGDWASYNVTFAVAGGTINGAATWAGTINYGRFEFNPLGDGNYLASGIG